jgi:hypothetical protein
MALGSRARSESRKGIGGFRSEFATTESAAGAGRSRRCFVKPLLASSPWLTIHPSIHRKLAAAAAILTASGLAAPAFANNPIEPPAYSAVDRLAAEEGGDPLYQRGSKVGTIQIGVTTAKTSITIGNVTWVIRKSCGFLGEAWSFILRPRRSALGGTPPSGSPCRAAPPSSSLFPWTLQIADPGLPARFAVLVAPANRWRTGRAAG